MYSIIRIKNKSNVHYTRGITPKHVTSGGGSISAALRLDNITLNKHRSGDTVSDLTYPRIEPRTSRTATTPTRTSPMIDMTITFFPTDSAVYLQSSATTPSSGGHEQGRCVPALPPHSNHSRPGPRRADRRICPPTWGNIERGGDYPRTSCRYPLPHTDHPPGCAVTWWNLPAPSKWYVNPDLHHNQWCRHN